MPRKSPVRLSFAEKYRVTQWLGAQAEKILSERPTGAALSETVQKTLGLYVNEDLVRELAEAAGLAWEPLYHTGAAARGSAHSRINQMENQFFEAHKDIECLSGRLHLLAAQLDKQAAALSGLRHLVSHLYSECGVDPLNGDAKVVGLPAHLLVEPKGGAA